MSQQEDDLRALAKIMDFLRAISIVNGVSESLFRRGLCLPSGPYVTDENFDYMSRRGVEAPPRHCFFNVTFPRSIIRRF